MSEACCAAAFALKRRAGSTGGLRGIVIAASRVDLFEPFERPREPEP